MKTYVLTSEVTYTTVAQLMIGAAVPSLTQSIVDAWTKDLTKNIWGMDVIGESFCPCLRDRNNTKYKVEAYNDRILIKKRERTHNHIEEGIDCF